MNVSGVSMWLLRCRRTAAAVAVSVWRRLAAVRRRHGLAVAAQIAAGVGLGGLGLLPVSSALAAPLGTAFTYQGQLSRNGAAASGLFDFQFCVFDSALTPSGGICAPDLADVPVQGGVFTVDLDFGPALFAGELRFLETRVRDGASTDGYSVLLPRQAVRPTPEALNAARVPWAGVIGIPADFADGTDDRGITQITMGAGLAGGSITTQGTVSVAPAGVVQSMIAPGAVGTGQLAAAAVGAAQLQAAAVDTAALADGSVTRSKLALVAVDTPQLADNAVNAAKLADAAVDTGALADLSVTRPKIALGAIGAEQIDPAQIQLRISGSCGPDEYVRGISAAGTLICNALRMAFTRTLETFTPTVLPIAADYTALALTSDGRPLVAYYNTTAKDLKLYVCADTTCSSGTTRTLDATGDVGNWVSMAMRPGDRALIAYYAADTADLKVYDCADAQCSSGTSRTLDGVDSVGGFTALAVRTDGRGVIAYYDQTNTDQKLFFCSDFACTSGTTHLNSSPGYVGQANSLVLRANGNVFSAHYAVQTGGLFTLSCLDATCSSTTGGTLRFDGGSQTMYTATVLRTDGRPLVAVYDIASGARDLSLFDCQNTDCAGNSQPMRKLDTAGEVGEGVSMAMGVDGRPVISYYDRTNGALKFYRCSDTNCSGGGAITLDDVGNVGIYTSVLVRPDGRPVISYWDVGNGAVKLHICANAECS